MDDQFTRPYVGPDGYVVYLTDAQAAERTDIRRLMAGEVPRIHPTMVDGLNPPGEIVPTVAGVPQPVTQEAPSTTSAGLTQPGVIGWRTGR